MDTRGLMILEVVEAVQEGLTSTRMMDLVIAITVGRSTNRMGNRIAEDRRDTLIVMKKEGSTLITATKNITSQISF